MNKKANAKYKPVLEDERDLSELCHGCFSSCIEVAVVGFWKFLRLTLARTLRYLVVVREQTQLLPQTQS